MLLHHFSLPNLGKRGESLWTISPSSSLVVLKRGKEKWPTWRHGTLPSVKWNEQAEIGEKKKKKSPRLSWWGKKKLKDLWEFRSLSSHSMSWLRRMKESFIPNLFVLAFCICSAALTAVARLEGRVHPHLSYFMLSWEATMCVIGGRQSKHLCREAPP